MSRELIIARIEKLNLKECGAEIFIELNNFRVEEPLTISQLKTHARHLKNSLSDKGISIKTTQSQELVAAFHGFKNWREVTSILK